MNRIAIVAVLAWSMGWVARADGDTVLRVVTPAGETREILPKGTTVTMVPQAGEAGGTSMVRIDSPASVAPERVIVELRRPPLVAGGSKRPSKPARDALVAEHGRVVAEISRLARAAGRRAALPAVGREFYLAFNGFAATLTRAEQGVLRAHPDVKSIHPDAVMKAVLDTSVPFVGAPAFWAAHGGYRGAGEVIAVIDTGVDYTHPDLGGCIAPGAGCKVLGGYDFYNGDANPLDDHGHGTHVASIAAGNGALLGVAPDARLLAYKVLNAGGFGASSTVMAGIEAAIDPNGDTDTSDHADVINLSLGGPGGPDDPVAQAVDNATAAGVLVIAAAGNDGGYRSIGSPAAARTALTVGAVDETPTVAWFTSGGPVGTTFELKPEVAAPGVSICAARAAGTALGTGCLDAGHVLLDGTSMAAPHVAGAAALVRGVAPALSPSEVKSLLVQNASPIVADPLKVGSGILNVPAAAAAHTVVDPQTISFGRDDSSQPVWTATRALTVRNLDASSRSYDLSAAGFYVGLPPGADLSFSPASFVLAAGQSTSVDVQLSVDNAQAPDAYAPRYAYDAMIELHSGGETQRIPMIFVKTSLLRVHTDRVASLVYVHDRTLLYTAQAVAPTSTIADVFVPAGTYDVMVRFPGGYGTFVVHEGVVVVDRADETISSAEAVHTVSLAGVDENGAPLADTMRNFSVYHRQGGLGMATVTSNVSLPFSISVNSMSPAYDVDVALLAEYEGLGKTYFVTQGVNGVAASHALGNSANALTRGELRHTPFPGEVTSLRMDFLMFVASPYFGFGAGTSRNIALGLDQDLYVTPVPHPRYRGMANAQTRSWPYHESPLYRGAAATGSIEAYNWFDVDKPVYRTTTGELPVNLGPASFFALFGNTNLSVSLQWIAGTWTWTFHDQGGDGPEAPGGTIGWRLLSGEDVVASGVAPQSSNGGPLLPFIYPVPSGPYIFDTDPLPYWVGGLHATTRIRAIFDTSRFPFGDVNPPYVSAFHVRSGGRLTDAVPLGAAATLSVEVHDNQDEAGTVVSLLREQGGTQTPVALTALGGGLFDALLGNPCPVAGPVNLILVATDSSGNELREWLTPAFVCRPVTCGNGVINAGEACDDGNTVSGDGCNAACSSAEQCGDGVLDAGEGCDDANGVSGDCCSSACQPEVAGSACNDGSACTTNDACANGACVGVAQPPPAEVDDGVRLQPDGANTLISWNTALGATTSEVVRGLLSGLPVGPGGSDEMCLASGLAGASTTDAATPVAGSGFWYLVRGRHSCGAGTYGFQRLHGLPIAGRATSACP